MGSGKCQVAGDGILVDLDQAAGGAGAAALAEVVEDGESFLVGESGMLQDGPFPLGEGAFAGATEDQTDATGFAAETTKVEIFAASQARLGAVVVLAAEVLDGEYQV